jgi:hypothetical protein
LWYAKEKADDIQRRKSVKLPKMRHVMRRRLERGKRSRLVHESKRPELPRLEPSEKRIERPISKRSVNSRNERKRLHADEPVEVDLVSDDLGPRLPPHLHQLTEGSEHRLLPPRLVDGERSKPPSLPVVEHHRLLLPLPPPLPPFPPLRLRPHRPRLRLRLRRSQRRLVLVDIPDRDGREEWDEEDEGVVRQRLVRVVERELELELPVVVGGS